MLCPQLLYCDKKGESNCTSNAMRNSHNLKIHFITLFHFINYIHKNEDSQKKEWTKQLNLREMIGSFITYTIYSCHVLVVYSK